VIALAIVGTTSHWLLGVVLILISSVVGLHGLASGVRAPSGIMVLIALLTLGFAATT
jgi:hypothetical protein